MLTLDQALTVATSAMGEGTKREFQPLCVAVLDPGAHVLALLRHEKASIGRPDIAIAKAAGCLSMGFGGRELARRAQEMPQFFTALAGIFPKGIIPLAGAVLIRNSANDIVGCVGISGDTSENDEVCAIAGIEAVNLAPDTGARRP
jgi:uncharacterized protein GlcG (DUF336 family)